MSSRKALVSGAVSVAAVAFLGSGCAGPESDDPQGGAIELAATASSLQLSWTDTANNEDGFHVRRTVSGGTYSVIKTLSADVTAYLDSGLTSDTSYCYQVRAFNAAGNSAWCKEACGTTAGGFGDSGPAPVDARSDGASDVRCCTDVGDSTTEQDSGAASRDAAVAPDSHVVSGDIAADASSIPPRGAASQNHLDGGCGVLAGAEPAAGGALGLLVFVLGAVLRRRMSDHVSRGNGISRRKFVRGLGLVSVAAAAHCLLPAPAMAQGSGRPNILLMFGEDMSPDLGCYGTPLIKTPNIDRLAAEGAKYTNVFSTAPICSPNRSAMITGMYQTSIDAHNHRSHRDDGYTLPPPIRIITHYLRAAGYYTANIKRLGPHTDGSGKTDFNFNVSNPFDSDTLDPPAGTPFYAQINFRSPHRGAGWSDNGSLTYHVKPNLVRLPPYYPDHPDAREDWADYLDAIMVLDRNVGRVLDYLDRNNLTHNTIVIFMGDNGRCHFRDKRWLYDGGLRVPLILRWPGKVTPGTVNSDLISTIDIAASTLGFAGVAVPSHMEGRKTLISKSGGRDYIVAARDRTGEAIDCIRGVRTKNFKYIRNYRRYKAYMQPHPYIDDNYPMIPLMKSLHSQGKLTPAQQLFMAPTKPAEELFDMQKDPHEINNLAGDPSYRSILIDLRAKLDNWIKTTGDKGTLLIDQAPNAVIHRAYSHKLDIYGGKPPYKLSFVSGNLPDGLSFEAGTGRILGTPTKTGSFSFAIRVEDSFADNPRVHQDLTMQVAGDTTPPAAPKGLRITAS